MHLFFYVNVCVVLVRITHLDERERGGEKSGFLVLGLNKPH